MPRLPSHHVARPRLVEPCLDAGFAVVVVEAAAGFGKTVLGRELVEAWGAVPVEVTLEEGPVPASLLASRLRAAVARAGFTDAAEQMAAAGEDPAGAVDAMLAGLEGEDVAFVVDDAHHAARDATVVIDRLAAGLTPGCRLVVLARRLPDGLERLRRAGVERLGAAELALREDETRALCRQGFGLDVSAADVAALESATGGWTAAVVLAASRAKHSSRRVRDLATAVSGTASATDPVAAMLEEVLVALGPAQRALGELASLPVLDEALVTDVSGDAGLFARALAVGLPLSRGDDGWWELPGPVRERLRARWPPDPAALIRAARHYEVRGEPALALRLLLAAHEDDAAAELLAGLDPSSLERVDALELLAHLAQLPDDWPERHPGAALAIIRACGVSGLLAPRGRLVDRLTEQIADDDPVGRGVRAELALDEVNRGHPDRAEALGREVVAAAEASEWFTRARARSAVGFGLCARRAPDGSIDAGALEEAAASFDRAAASYRQRGCVTWISGIAAARAMWTELALGRATAALEVLDQALAACAGRPRRVCRLLIQRSQVHVHLGRLEDSALDLDEAEHLGRQLGDVLTTACANWGRMALASHRGDAAAVQRSAREVEDQRGDWWSVIGAEYLADAADCHDRVGLVAIAHEYLDRARAEPHHTERWVALAEGALLARHGDPALAEERLATVHRHGVFPRDAWRVTLLRAYAAWRHGEPSSGALASRAFHEAGSIGVPELPLVLERELATSLLALAVEAGSEEAGRLDDLALPLSLSVLGRVELTRGGRPVALGTGRPAQLLKVVVARGGRAHAEQVIEALWPGSDLQAGRGRLRVAHSRLRDVAPEAVLRDGETLVLGPELRCDLVDFEREARRALSLRATDRDAALAWARSAIARYRGELLPDDVYEEWADAPREAARRTMLDLLDLCAEAAAQRGDLDEARRMVQRTIELAPDEDDRYLHVAQLLAAQGRRGAALSVIRRARATLDALGLELPDALVELRDALRQRPRRPSPPSGLPRP